jgi:tRNA(Ile)-lysidine synthase
MRASGVRVSAPREWSPSPVWPEGRELFLLRPLIAARRTALRAWLAAHGEAWIEDPANLDPRQPRARARADLAAGFAPDPRLDHRDETPTFPSARIGRAGEVSIDLAALSGEPAFLAAAIACASGRETLPRAPSVLKLFYRLTQMPQARATLGGTRILARQGQVTVAREIGDGRQGEAPSICLAPGETVIWDGRFEVRARAAGLTIGPLAGRAARLDRSMRDLLGGQNAICRPALPTIVDDRGEVSCPTLVRDPRIDIRGLVAARLAGASGAIQSETNLLSCRDGEPL